MCIINLKPDGYDYYWNFGDKNHIYGYEYNRGCLSKPGGILIPKLIDMCDDHGIKINLCRSIEGIEYDANYSISEVLKMFTNSLHNDFFIAISIDPDSIITIADLEQANFKRIDFVNMEDGSEVYVYMNKLVMTAIQKSKMKGINK